MGAFAHKQNQPQKSEPSNRSPFHTAIAGQMHGQDRAPEWQPASEKTPANQKHPNFRWNLSQISILPPSAQSTPSIQAKLALNHPTDAYEREADHVAAQVMHMTPPATIAPVAASAPHCIQRKCACGGSCSKCQQDQAVPEHVPEHEHEHVQRKPVNSNDAAHIAAPAIVHEAFRSASQPLSTAARSFMEPRFGRDFSNVRIHTGPIAERSVEAIFARAFTGGRHIVFGPGHYRPDTPEGRRLLAHELTHVVQQSGHAAIQRSPDDRWKKDVHAARYRGQLMADRIKKHGKLSTEAHAKMNSELQYFEGSAKDEYVQAITPALTIVVGLEMPEMDMAQKPPAVPPEKPKPPACTRLPDASGGKKCKFYVYDSTLDDKVGIGWEAASLAFAAPRPATYVVKSGQNIEELLYNLLSAYAEKDCDCTDEVQFWSHGSSGNGGWISHSKGGTSQFETAVFNIPDVEKFGDNPKMPGYQEWESKLSALQRRLVILRRTVCDSDSTIYYRSCDGFQGPQGKDFAKASSKFWRCDVSGHTKNIGLTQPGKHTLSACQEPDWPDTEGVGEEGKKGKDSLRDVKPR